MEPSTTGRIGLVTSLLFAAPLAVVTGKGDPRAGMGKIKEYFTDKGLTASDLPKALIFHEVISVAFAAFTWTVRRRSTWVTPHRIHPYAPSKGGGQTAHARIFTDFFFPFDSDVADLLRHSA